MRFCTVYIREMSKVTAKEKNSKSRWSLESGHSEIPSYQMLCIEQESLRPDPKKAGWGITTGSCLCAAAAASLNENNEIEIELVHGPRILVEAFDHTSPACFEPYAEKLKARGFKACPVKLVIKDAGEDPDISDGAKFFAQAFTARRSLIADLKEELNEALYMSLSNDQLILIACEGIGKITKAGLKLDLGSPAINPGPQTMLIKLFKSYCQALSAEQQSDCLVVILLAIEDGAALAKKTFNPRLGIKGGLSVLGTSGFVRPMSQEALIASLLLELKQKEQETKRLILSFGARGERQLKAVLTASDQESMQVSNYLGVVLDEIAKGPLSEIIVGGHLGKMLKLVAGVMNTHSAVADARSEVLCTELALMRAPYDLIAKVYEANTSEEMFDYIQAAGYSKIWERLAEKIVQQVLLRLSKHKDELELRKMKIKALLLDQEGHILAAAESKNET